MRRHIHHLFCKIVIFTVFLSLFWSECLALFLSSIYWINQIKYPGTIRILIVADPQLIGYQDEPRIIGPFSRWDSDRYIRRAFSIINDYMKPHIIIYLGDLFDEGFKASDEQFYWTLDRFKSIFRTKPPQQLIFLPGDNDIGGELEYVHLKSLMRFQQNFGSNFDPSSISFGPISLIHTNSLNGKIDYFTNESIVENSLRIMLCHLPIISGFEREKKMLEKIDPHLILSAHDHSAHYLIYRKKLQNFNRHSIHPGDSTIDFQISVNEPLFELQFPTCSYRMGVYDIGYGVIFIEPPKFDLKMHATFAIFWIPGRYPQLVLYLFIIIIACCLFVYTFWKTIQL